MTQARTPTVNRRQLGAELRRLRTARGLRIEDVAKHLGCSETRVSRLETGKGRVVPRRDEIEKLCQLFQITDERQIEMLLSMLSNSREPGWWDAYREVLPSGLEALLGLETDSRAELAWEPVLVHGLLQTPDYARAVLSAHPSNRLHDIDDLVAVRTNRQSLLTTPQHRDPLELWAILDEHVIRRPVGGPEVMRGQLRHLVAMAALPNVTLQIVPVAKGAHPGLSGAFSILEFEESPTVVYADTPAGNLYVEKKHDVRQFITSFDLLKAKALDPEESTALLQAAAEETP
ncbi:helix-turn-helix transcriptional regulator [Streptomyces scabiei]|uniref:helix-turn-helix domain-containing protein n=1 Tax=Streptomyces scabiei TaxID=1930 RepID=UPI00298FB93E|nr:helix-turn-helix transcriptional regulator [Streptomyces scabiei]MDW8804365.1 helix-turn-helix transcriptional regulator [Streptomyces scabiei]